ncbi:radical SAM protein [Geoalkalibacter subterraneus]|uniref:Radical SAM protein n=1 Tax=Geoalkalibacter subterraneus TaxID=483547 RepID=A0A0B5FT03_9BACT|nr:radical SAM protein [Geoalkalibacter subterraneus]AJF07285.1 radical SAM protein [Geoalkalibacter subterraneus]
MSRRLLDKARRRLAAESGDRANPWGGRLAVALVYPNTYHHAMSNLGFLTVYHLLNQRDDVLCERFFLPDPEDLKEHRNTGYPLFSLESGRFLDEFDLIAFSLSFENDYLHLPTIFELGRLPWRSDARDERSPLLLAGGVCAFLNPEPLADVVDLFAVGEAEPILPSLLETLQANTGDRAELLVRLARQPGLYVPSLYEATYDEHGQFAGHHPLADIPAKVERQYLADLNQSPSLSFVLTPNTEFGEMFLSEISRGCSRGCRFCAAGYIYLPPRERSFETLREQIDAGLCHRARVGLVGAAVSDHPDAPALQRHILEHGGEVSVSSLRLDALRQEEIEDLVASGHKTVAIAPEAGSQRMRDLINKGIDREQILEAVHRLAEAGMINLKLYFLIGLPGEADEDIEAIIALSDEIRLIWREAGRRRGRLGTLTLSVNPFIPKPFTPFQWAGMGSEKALRKAVKTLRSAVAHMPNTEVIFESLKSAVLQAFLARADRRAAEVIRLLAQGKNLKAACREQGLDPDAVVIRERDPHEVFPWEIIDNRVRREYLLQEYRRALQCDPTPRRAPGCVRCGVCGQPTATATHS